jgi:hypothetical protein
MQDKEMAYADAVLERYAQGQQCIFTEYANLYGGLFALYEAEDGTAMTDVGFVLACAAQDYRDGALGAVVYHEVYDALHGEDGV